jgi:hypothetical protein
VGERRVSGRGWSVDSWWIVDWRRGRILAGLVWRSWVCSLLREGLSSPVVPLNIGLLVCSYGL